jgi:hypothetical protein
MDISEYHSNINQYHPISSIITQYHPISLEYYPISHGYHVDITEYHPTSPNITQYHPILPNTTWTSPSITQYHTDISEHHLNINQYHQIKSSQVTTLPNAKSQAKDKRAKDRQKYAAYQPISPDITQISHGYHRMPPNITWISSIITR